MMSCAAELDSHTLLKETTNMAETDKAVILARGLGTRMQAADDDADLNRQEAAAADTGVKALIPIGRPFLDYVLTGLSQAGFRRVCLVVAPDHEAFRRYYQEEAPPRKVSIEFAVQAEPKGTADAIAAAEDFAGDDPVVMLNSDNYYPPEALEPLRRQPGSGLALFEWESMTAGSNIPRERLRRFAVGLFDQENVLTQILEKPDEATWEALPRPLWLSMNCWRFNPAIFEACHRIEPSKRGEYEITDAVQYAIDRLDERFTAVPVRVPVLDLTGRKDISQLKDILATMEVEY